MMPSRPTSLQGAVDGQEIAKKLQISVETERNHVASILAKLRAHSRLQALVFAILQAFYHPILREEV